MIDRILVGILTVLGFVERAGGLVRGKMVWHVVVNEFSGILVVSN